ncbi:MAG: BNR-4 repeat-containing protein [Bryobacterales bacterium]
MRASTALFLFLAGCGSGPQNPPQTPPAEAAAPFVVADDAGWCWFEDERALVSGDTLIVGSVASGRRDPARKGDIQVTVYDLSSGAAQTIELHDQLQLDDHDSPALIERPDGRFLAVYAQHGNENHFYYRVSEPNQPAQWGPERQYVPSEPTRLTYQNLYLLRDENQPKGRLYDFFRGLHNSYKPSYVYSDDWGETWQTGAVVIHVPTEYRHRPYVKYASDGQASVHLFYTEGHPRNYDNSVYHVVYSKGELHGSDGTAIAKLDQGLERPEQGTLVFAGDPNNVAWVSDLQLDPQGRPVGVFSVQKDSAELPDGVAGEDLRYHYARWDGEHWVEHELAYAGGKLYPGEDDYTGNIALDPAKLDTVYFSSDADPATGAPLISAADGKRHYEIFRGHTEDGGASWNFTPVTRDSTLDNIRPLLPSAPAGRRVLLWLRGEYRAYTDFDLQAMALRLD